jgi:hypothetical protein
VDTDRRHVQGWPSISCVGTCLSHRSLGRVVLLSQGVLSTGLSSEQRIGWISDRHCRRLCCWYIRLLLSRCASRLYCSPTHSLALNVRRTLLPRLRPTVVTDRIAQCEKWLHVRSAPIYGCVIRFATIPIGSHKRTWQTISQNREIRTVAAAPRYPRQADSRSHWCRQEHD